MPRRLPPMPDSPREAAPLCSQCSAEGVQTNSCLKPNLHQPVGRFSDRFLFDEDGSGSVDAVLRTPRASMLQPLGISNMGRRTSGGAGSDGMDDDDSDDAQSMTGYAEQEVLPPKRNILPPLHPRVEMAVMRKLYMAGMTVSPRSRQIKPLPQLGEKPEQELEDDIARINGPAWSDDDDLDLPPTVYDPSLLDESLVRELSLENLLRPEISHQRPQRMRLDPISGVKVKPVIAAVADVFSPRPITRQAVRIPSVSADITET